LLHQLFKWDITAQRDSKHSMEEEARLRQLFATMTLYLDMHDAKFEGGTALVGCTDFTALFESDKGFDRVFSQALSQETDRRIPRRGLREIMRFGHLPLLKAVGRDVLIDDTVIERVKPEAKQDGGQSKITTLQQRREELHDRWVEKKRHFEEADLHEYCETVAAISEHRRDSALVNLVDHVRVHRIVMVVLGRLVDYMGLFERDLYFVTLALIYQQNLRLEDLFEERGTEYLLNGQIIFALREHRKGSSQAVDILKELARHFTEVWARGNPATNVRNDLAHLNMLQGAAPAPRLTHWVNQTRRLMAYDRKLKNAVSKSVIELMAREGIELRWQMKTGGEAHDLIYAELSSRSAKHLGGKQLTLRDGGPKSRKIQLEERLHGAGFVEMIAATFDGNARRTASIVENLSKVDWKASSADNKRLRETSSKRPSPNRRKETQTSLKST